MSVNKYQPHLLILPEDEAISAIATGFLLHPALNASAVQVLPHAGGWNAVVKKFQDTHSKAVRSYGERRIVLLVDCDQDEKRIDHVKESIPEDLRDRGFVLGIWQEAETLNKSLGFKGFEAIGKALADNCAENVETLWEHEQLRHNQAEVRRLVQSVKPFLFP